MYLNLKLFSLGTPVSFTNKTGHITEIFVKVALNTITIESKSDQILICLQVMKTTSVSFFIRQKKNPVLCFC